MFFSLRIVYKTNMTLFKILYLYLVAGKKSWHFEQEALLCITEASTLSKITTTWSSKKYTHYFKSLVRSSHLKYCIRIKHKSQIFKTLKGRKKTQSKIKFTSSDKFPTKRGLPLDGCS